MAQWDNYSSKATPEDTDTLMLKDNTATGKPNKRLLFSGLWNWIVSKLTNSTISTLETTPKTIIGGINNLNSNSYSLGTTTYLQPNTDLNTIITPGNYASQSATVSSTLVNTPVTTLGFAMKVEYINNTSAIRQTLFTRGATPNTYERTGVISSTSVTFDNDWLRQPTRFEMDDLNSRSNLTRLWHGVQKEGEITLSIPDTAYTKLLFVYRTNFETTSVYITKERLSATNPAYAHICSGEWNEDKNCWTYDSWCSVYRDSETKYHVVTKYNNINFQLGIIAVYGQE